LRAYEQKHDSEILLYAKAKNLLNENIRNSTSYLRNFAPEPGRSAEIEIRISYEAFCRFSFLHAIVGDKFYQE
jgi:hypothetical protein